MIPELPIVPFFHFHVLLNVNKRKKQQQKTNKQTNKKKEGSGMKVRRNLYTLDQELMSAAKQHEGTINCHTFVVPSSVEFSASKTRLIR